MPSLRFAAVQVSVAAATALLCLAAATQWAAAMLGYQPGLGAPLIDLLGLKLYAPWKLFAWWLAFDAQAPHVFARWRLHRSRQRAERRARHRGSRPAGGP
jgi:type IV secretion system protein VirD4